MGSQISEIYSSIVLSNTQVYDAGLVLNTAHYSNCNSILNVFNISKRDEILLLVLATGKGDTPTFLYQLSQNGTITYPKHPTIGYRYMASQRFGIYWLLAIASSLLILWKLLSMATKASPIGNLQAYYKDCLPSDDSSPISDQSSEESKQLRNLIIVPGHAIQWCTDFYQPYDDPSCWFLYDFQKKQLPIYLEHIKVGVQLAVADLQSILVFSGGQTRNGAGPRSEARSYYSIASAACLIQKSLLKRTILEEFARDSLENLIFSMARFRELTGKLPDKVTIVGFPFKERRFRELHRVAANIPEGALEYIPVIVPGINQTALVDDAYHDFLNDLYGCGTKLMGKKNSRNPYKQNHGYKDSCPELASILSKCRP